MAESTCFLRSFSNTTVAIKGDRIRALGESISFGGSISESMAWENLSGFSRNRYVEEAERLSMPGSVAEKKSYFEAYFKTKRAAALIQKEDASADETFDSETQEENCNYSYTEITSNVEINETVTEQLDENAVNHQVVDCANRSENRCDSEQSEADISKVARAENVTQTQVDANLNVENSLQVHNSNLLHNVEVHEKIAVPSEKWMPDPAAAGQEISVLPIKEREVCSSPKLSMSTNTIAAELSQSLPQRNATDSASESKESVGGGSIGNRRLTAQPLHVSNNLPPLPGETSETDSVCELERTKNIDPNLPKISKDHPVASQTSTTASHGSFHQASANPKSESRRTQRTLNKSVSEGVTANAKVSSFSIECLKPSSLPRVSPRPPTVLSPFRFRSEERAAKRKKFFERIEEIKSKEAEKVQLQRRSKEKTEHAHKKLRQNSGSNPKLDEDRCGGLQSPNKQKRKTPLGRKQNSSAVKESRNSRKLPISTNNSKRVTEKINQTTRSFVTLAKKTPRENASPNIQR